MKRYLHKKVLFLFALSMIILLNKKAISQDVAPENEKLSVSMNLIYKEVNGIKSVKVQVSRKENKKFVSVTGPIVNLYLNEVVKHDPETGNGWIGNATLNEDGEALFELTNSLQKITDGKYEFTFISRMFGDPKYEDTEEEITVTEAEISIAISEEDSQKTVTAQLVGWQDDTTKAPVPEQEMKLFVKRAFSLLPIGEEGLTTDENGQVSAIIPPDLPGEANGTIIVVARVEEHESYGTVEASQDTPWGVLPKIRTEHKRSLWATGANAPVPLVLASLSIITVIWGTIFYLILLLRKIKKLGKE